LTVEFTLPAGSALTAEQKQMLEHAANTCPVHKALHGHVEMPVTFRWT
jgi:organic hydroperoxide reductase OsmC/OhrA